MGEKRKAYRLLVRKPEVKRPIGRSVDNIEIDRVEIELVGLDWIGLVWLRIGRGGELLRTRQ
jgi:hypothetical protein